MAYVIPAPVQAALPVLGTASLFPVNRVFCIGRNYAAHAVEMGHDPDKEPPFFFLKSPSNLITDGRFAYPTMTADVHHELEMVVALSQGGDDILVESALDHVFGYGLGLDMTRRDLQGEANLWGGHGRWEKRLRTRRRAALWCLSRCAGILRQAR